MTEYHLWKPLSLEETVKKSSLTNSNTTAMVPSSSYFSNILIRKQAATYESGQEIQQQIMASTDFDTENINKTKTDPLKSVKSVSINALKKGMKIGKSSASNNLQSSTSTTTIRVGVNSWILRIFGIFM